MKRTYGEYCGLAHALDRVGERWSLLIVRGLLDGPQRFVDLQAAMPGIPTDRLSARLREMQEAGIVERMKLPPPAGSVAYRLTPLGAALEPALVALARWGLKTLGPRRRRDPFHLGWLGLWFRAVFDAQVAADADFEAEIRSADQVCRVVVRSGAMSFHMTEGDAPDVRVSGVLAGASSDPFSQLDIEGKADKIRQFRRVFGLGSAR